MTWTPSCCMFDWFFLASFIKKILSMQSFAQAFPTQLQWHFCCLLRWLVLQTKSEKRLNLMTNNQVLPTNCGRVESWMPVIFTLTAPEESKEGHICLVFPQQCFESRLTWLEQDVLTRLSGPNMHEYKGQGDDASSNLMISRSLNRKHRKRKKPPYQIFCIVIVITTVNAARFAPLQNGQLQQRLDNVQRDFIVFNRERYGPSSLPVIAASLCIGYATPEKSDFWFHKPYKDVSGESFLVNFAFCSFAQQIEKNCNGLFWAVHQWEE